MFGVLNLDKPAGVTSRDCVDVVQKLVRPLKAGHAGTLDPMATGVLLVCIGPATRLIPLLQQQSKTYAATFRLGETSDTDDSTGHITSVQSSARYSVDQLKQHLASFVGQIQQVPPAFSAVKVAGQRAYRKARQGESFQLSERTVQVHRIELRRFEWPEVDVEIECGSGTYIRSIARDLGQTLGCGGLMSALRRTAIGPFPVSGGVHPDDLTRESLPRALHDPIAVLPHHPVRRCTPAERHDIQRGRRIPVGEIPSSESSPNSQNLASAPSPILLASEDGQTLLALAEIREKDGQTVLQPRTVFDRLDTDQTD